MAEPLSPEERSSILDAEVMRYARQGYQVRAYPDHRATRQTQEVQLHLGTRVVPALRHRYHRLLTLLLGQARPDDLPGSRRAREHPTRLRAIMRRSASC